MAGVLVICPAAVLGRLVLPPSLAEHDLIRSAWEGLDATRVWDCHAHLAGIGDGGSGVTITPRMLSPLHPTEYFQRLFYLNAGFNCPLENFSCSA